MVGILQATQTGQGPLVATPSFLFDQIRETAALRFAEKKVVIDEKFQQTKADLDSESERYISVKAQINNASASVENGQESIERIRTILLNLRTTVAYAGETGEDVEFRAEEFDLAFNAINNEANRLSQAFNLVGSIERSEFTPNEIEYRSDLGVQTTKLEGTHVGSDYRINVLYGTDQANITSAGISAYQAAIDAGKSTDAAFSEGVAASRVVARAQGFNMASFDFGVAIVNAIHAQNLAAGMEGIDAFVNAIARVSGPTDEETGTVWVPELGVDLVQQYSELQGMLGTTTSVGGLELTNTSSTRNAVEQLAFDDATNFIIVAITIDPDAAPKKYGGTLQRDGLEIMPAWFYEGLATTEGRESAFEAISRAEVLLTLAEGKLEASAAKVSSDSARISREFDRLSAEKTQAQLKQIDEVDSLLIEAVQQQQAMLVNLDNLSRQQQNYVNVFANFVTNPFTFDLLA
ncbi:MAG: hypothetical protein ACJZ9F_04555 [Rhodospirillaceae bacterium]